MKQGICSFAALALMLAALPVSAETMNVEMRAKASTTPMKPRVEMRERVELKYATSSSMRPGMASSTLRAELEARKASSTARRVEMQQNIAKKIAERTAQMFTATIERLEKIVERVESRIAKLEAEGVSVAESKEAVVEAKTHLSEARASVAAFAAVDVSAEKARDNFATVKALAEEVKTHLKEARESLKEAVSSLKGPRSVETSTEASVN